MARGCRRPAAETIGGPRFRWPSRRARRPAAVAATRVLSVVGALAGRAVLDGCGIAAEAPRPPLAAEQGEEAGSGKGGGGSGRNKPNRNSYSRFNRPSSDYYRQQSSCYPSSWFLIRFPPPNLYEWVITYQPVASSRVACAISRIPCPARPPSPRSARGCAAP